MRAWGARLGLAVLLTLGLLGWELCLLEMLSGGFGVRASTVVPRLAWDALLLFPLWLVALWAMRHGRGAISPLPSGEGQGEGIRTRSSTRGPECGQGLNPSTPDTLTPSLSRRAREEGHGAAQGTTDPLSRAAALSLCFLVLLIPMAAGRAVFQRLSPPAPPSGATKDRPTSATARTLEADGRFVCAAVSADVPANDPAQDSGSLVATAVTGARDALLLQVPVFPLALWVLSRRRSRFAVTPVRAATSVFALVLPLGLFLAWRSDALHLPVRQSSLQEEQGGCRPGAPVRTYAVAAIPVDLPLNAHGDHVPQGFMYVLEEELPAVREQERRPWPERAARGLHDEPIQPLVLRANVGECLRVHFTNRLDTGPASLRIEGLPATVSGQGRGFVPGTAVPPGQGLTYVFSLPESAEAEGLYLLHDAEEGGAREARGLFGSLVLEPAGAVYRDASTGEPLRHGTGWEALIESPSGEGFRELVLLYHAMGAPDVADVRSAKGVPLPLLDEMAGLFRAGAYGVNYRSEPRFDREEPSGEDEDGEPRAVRTRELATPPLRSYLGEPVKLRVAQAGSAEFHVHHLHGGSEARGGRLREPSGTPAETPRLLSPGRGFTLTLGGPGDFPQKAGDFLVHCHVPNHFTGGERLSWHVFSAPQPGLAPLATAPR